MKIALLTNEYPPNVYGGAGIHIEYLTRELAKLENEKNLINVLCFGEQASNSGTLSVQGIDNGLQMTTRDPRHLKFMDALYKNMFMVEALEDIDLVHCHTWYTHFAGCLIKQMLKVPLVLTTHSLEPHRPWKREQLGTAFNATSWIEKTAYQNADGIIAVSESMQKDVEELYRVSPENIRVIYNGIDLNEYKPTPDPALVQSYGIDPTRPFILFVGRITVQKGIGHFVDAIKYLNPGNQVVLCAGTPDTDELGREIAGKVAEARSRTATDVIWIPRLLPKEHLISLYTHAAIFVCPSIYEPFGIINLEAMACGTPVVASAVGGIVEAVKDGETGTLVYYEPLGRGSLESKEPDKFAQDLATAINLLLSAPEKLETMGIAARKRVERYFSWESIARQTLQFYKELTGESGMNRSNAPTSTVVSL
ncbi:MAG: glycogen synthase [Desulfoferrobacter sp.]